MTARFHAHDSRLFQTDAALISGRLIDSRKQIGNENDSFVAFHFLSEGEASAAHLCVPKGALIGTLLPAMNFDPPEDHPGEPEFCYSDVLLNDFSDVNDDVGTIHGVTKGHFATLLDWQPRINPSVTVLVGIVAPGPLWNRTEVKQIDALPRLAKALQQHGYNAIAIRCKAGDDAEFVDCARFAEEMKRSAGLPIFHLSTKARTIANTPFSMTIRDESLCKP